MESLPTPRSLPSTVEGEGARKKRLARESREIEQARASAAAGRTVPLEAVEAWVDSWNAVGERPMPRSGR